MKSILLGLTLFLSQAAWSAPAVLFEEVEVPGVPKESEAPLRKRKAATTESEIRPLSQRSSLKSIYEGQEFNSTEELRSKRRVGLGALTAGNVGLFGAMIELNLSPSQSAITAFGGGPGFNALNFQWKYVMGGQAFSPYAGLGYARWYNASDSKGGLDKTTPAVLGSRFLTQEQKRTGEFTVDLITPTLGLQYNQLSGEYTGMGLFGEIDFLTKVPDFAPVATGALGILYYF